jgi:hypothetical protein
MALAVIFSFLLGVSIRFCFAKQNAGSHTEGITKHSVVTLSFRPKRNHNIDTKNIGIIVFYCKNRSIVQLLVY